MNKKEISEIRKQFTPERCTISRICGCYVDGDKNIKMKMARSFLTLAEEEIHKYLDIFKKTLSGTLDKNLMNLDFDLAQEEEGGFQHLLMQLRSCRLENEDLLDDFYDRIITHYNYGENYLILLIHAAYDIPGASSDGFGLEDASDDVYSHLLCSICPVNLSKAALSYLPDENVIGDRLRDWVVEMPLSGFLFPAFTDRTTDIHSMLYFSKNPEQLQPALIEELFGCTPPLTAGTQKDSFHALIEQTLEESCDYETVLTIHEKLDELVQAQKDEPDPVVLSQPEVRRLLEDSGVSEDRLEDFEEQCRLTAGSSPSWAAVNLLRAKTQIQTPDITVHVSNDKAALVETRQIDGRRCLVIPIEGEVEVNGIHIQ